MLTPGVLTPGELTPGEPTPGVPTPGVPTPGEPTPGVPRGRPHVSDYSAVHGHGRDATDICHLAAPWLSVRRSASAVEFYMRAFAAVEVYRLEDPGGGVVSRLSIDGAEFWLSDESPEHGSSSPESLGGGSVRMILTVADPDASFARALAAGASQVLPVTEEYGWRVGRVVDPFGHHWEIGRPLT